MKNKIMCGTSSWMTIMTALAAALTSNMLILIVVIGYDIAYAMLAIKLSGRTFEEINEKYDDVKSDVRADVDGARADIAPYLIVTNAIALLNIFF